MNSDTNPVRFLHSSDWQLGMTRAFLGDEAAARFSQARIDAIRRLGQLAVEHSASFIVVAGDVFESNQLSRQTVLRTLDALQALPVPIFLLAGNHDPLDAASIFATPEFKKSGEHIIVVRDTAPIPVPGLQDVEVLGAPWRTKHPNADLCGDLVESLASAEGVTRIMLGHGQVDSLSPDPSRPEIINLARVEAAVNTGRIHYLALGDRHSLTEVGSSGRIWYSGAPVATDFDEVDPNKCLLVELHRGKCDVTALMVGDWVFSAAQFNLNSTADLQVLADWLSSLPHKEKAIVKLGFTGTINLAIAAQLDALLLKQGELFASLKRRERTTDLVIVPDQLDQDSVSLTGYARSTWDELLCKAGGNVVAQNALRLFYRLSAQGEQP